MGGSEEGYREVLKKCEWLKSINVTSLTHAGHTLEHIVVVTHLRDVIDIFTILSILIDINSFRCFILIQNVVMFCVVWSFRKF